MLLCTIGFVYILVSIAGARITGATVVEQEGRQQIISNTMSIFANDVRCCGGDKDELSCFRHPDMLHAGVSRSKRLLINALTRCAGKGLERQGSNELAGRTGLIIGHDIRP